MSRGPEGRKDGTLGGGGGTRGPFEAAVARVLVCGFAFFIDVFSLSDRAVALSSFGLLTFSAVLVEGLVSAAWAVIFPAGKRAKLT